VGRIFSHIGGYGRSIRPGGEGGKGGFTRGRLFEKQGFLIRGGAGKSVSEIKVFVENYFHYSEGFGGN